MDVLVTGRRCTITDEFRDTVTERISSIERFRNRVIRVEVQVPHPNKRQPDNATRAEITLIGRGPSSGRSVRRRQEHCFRAGAGEAEVATAQGSRQAQGAQGLRVAQVLAEPPAQNRHRPRAGRRGGEGPVKVRNVGGLVLGTVRWWSGEALQGNSLNLAQALDEMELVGTTSSCTWTPRPARRAWCTAGRPTTSESSTWRGAAGPGIEKNPRGRNRTFRPLGIPGPLWAGESHPS